MHLLHKTYDHLSFLHYFKGQPWLVHSFKTYATDDSGNYAAASHKALRGRLPLSNLSPEKVVHVHNVNGLLIFNGFVSELKEINLPDGVYIIRID